jgi:hypothetical protein
VRGDVLAQPPARFVQAALGRAGRVADLVDRQVSVVVQGDGLPLPGGQPATARRST